MRGGVRRAGGRGSAAARVGETTRSSGAASTFCPAQRQEEDETRETDGLRERDQRQESCRERRRGGDERGRARVTVLSFPLQRCTSPVAPKKKTTALLSAKLSLVSRWRLWCVCVCVSVLLSGLSVVHVCLILVLFFFALLSFARSISLLFLTHTRTYIPFRSGLTLFSWFSFRPMTASPEHL